MLAFTWPAASAASAASAVSAMAAPLAHAMLMKRSRLMETGPEAFVLALSPDQWAAWLDSMIDAEGRRQPVVLAEGGRRHGASGEFVRIAQVDGPLQDAIKLAVYLEGYRPT